MYTFAAHDHTKGQAMAWPNPPGAQEGCGARPVHGNQWAGP